MFETGALTWHNVGGYYLDVAVPIRTSMLVPEAHDMSQLVDNDTELVAVFTDTDGLRATSSFAHKRATPAISNPSSQTGQTSQPFDGSKARLAHMVVR